MGLVQRTRYKDKTCVEYRESGSPYCWRRKFSKINPYQEHSLGASLMFQITDYNNR
jgi:hypothetical protein